MLCAEKGLLSDLCKFCKKKSGNYCRKLQDAICSKQCPVNAIEGELRKFIKYKEIR